MMLILIAGPYRSGTNNNPVLIERNMNRLEAAALPIFEKGHIPMIGEWVANPLIVLAGSKVIGDNIFQEIQYPMAHRLLTKCDALLRIEGTSKGADQDVKMAAELGLKVFYDIKDIPNAE